MQAVGELMSITGPRDGEPHKAGVALVDVLTGKDAVAAILAALLHPQRTGEGQRVSVDLMSSLLSALVNQASATLTTGESPSRMGNRHPSIAPYEALRCRDALLAVAVGNDAQFRVFMDVLGAPAIADDERFASNAQRVAHREELVALLEGCLARRDAADWEAELISVGIACGRINDVAGAMSYAERLGLAPLVPMPDGRVPQVRSPLILRGTGLAASVAPPSLGQHDQLVRARLRRSAPEGDQEPSPTLEGEDAS